MTEQPAPYQPNPQLKRIEHGFESLIFNSRWLMAPFYFGLVVSLAVLLLKFCMILWEFILHAPGSKESDIILGVLSLILWALIVVVAIKYVLILLRADNNGEGGTLSLTALASRALGRRTAVVFLLGVVGASMFLGDAVITPAISVLSAVEGLTLVTPAFEHYVAPLTIVILLGLFAAQSRGTARVASFFAPVMVVWFVAIAAAGVLHIHDDPAVLAAINPAYALAFLYGHGHVGLVTLGLVGIK